MRARAGRLREILFDSEPRAALAHPSRYKPTRVIVLGLILLVVGFIAKVAILWIIGVILLVVGLILVVLGSMGRAVGGRRHCY